MEAFQLQASPSQAVVEISDRPGFIALEAEWNALVGAVDDQIFYRHGFIRIWIDHFAPQARLRVLTLRDEAGKLTAVLPLVEERSNIYGVPIRELSAAANAHSCRFDLIAANREVAAAAFLQHLQADPRWDVLRVTDVPRGGAGYEILEAAKAAGMPVGSWSSLQSPFIPLPSTREEMQKRLDTKFKANLRRRRRKLEEKGKVTVERWSAGPDLEAKLEEGFALEQSGWKGQNGTAIAQDKATRSFYVELARAASAEGQLALYFLRLDGRAVGFHYALEYGGRYLLLKPGYDETLRECSPGQLLMDEVLADCVKRGLKEFDFLGPDMIWKRDWTDQVRPHEWLFIFRDSALGKLLCQAKFRWVPAAKEVVAKWKR